MRLEDMKNDIPETRLARARGKLRQELQEVSI